MDNLLLNLELKASEFRQRNGLNPAEAIRLKSLLQKNNVMTIYLPLTDDFAGMAVRLPDSDNPKRFLLINCNHTIGKQHFTICHEIYHLYFQENFKSEKGTAGTFNRHGDPEEFKADNFATFLLLPTNGLLQMMPDEERSRNKITLATILKIEQFYACSRSALLQRLLGMRLIDHDLFSAFSSDIIKNATLYGYNTDLYKPGNKGIVIGDYGQVARELFDRGLVSESSYFSLLEDLGIDLKQLDAGNGDQ